MCLARGMDRCREARRQHQEFNWNSSNLNEIECQEACGEVIFLILMLLKCEALTPLIHIWMSNAMAE